MSILDRRADRAAIGGGSVVPELDLRYAAQIRAAGVLVDLLVMGGDLGLPLLGWSVGFRGSISGHGTGFTDEQMRASFEAWVKALGASRLADDISILGSVILRAQVEDFRGCEVRLSAHLLAVAGGEDE